LLSKPSLFSKGKKRGFTLSRRWKNIIAYSLVLATIISGMATYAALTETPPLGNDPDTVIWLLNIDLIILLMLIAMIARRIVRLWSGRKRGLAGSHLHVRLVYTFSILAAAPAIIMTVFSAFFFHFGVQTWFSQRVETAVFESQAVAEAYLEEHKQIIRADTLAMANDIDRQAPLLRGNVNAFDRVMQTQSLLRNLSESIVFDSSGEVLARSGLTFALEFQKVPDDAMRKAEEGEVVIMTGENDDRVRALVKLTNMEGAFLFVGRMVDPKVLSHVTDTRQAAQDYADLQARTSGLQVSVTMIFVVVGLVLMMGAIWFGLLLARQLVTPISSMITTVDRVSAGDLSAKAETDGSIEEFDYLAEAFNRMTKQIQEQQRELIEANRQLDRRRRFTETVLAGVPSGVIGVDPHGIITLANNSSFKLLGLGESDLLNKNIRDALPELREILDQAHERPSKVTQAQIPIEQKDGTRKMFLVRIAIEIVGTEDTGAIVTFDDITDLQSAQRKAAWADVARRIAHEIKNPLTPIQLSAERLRRKYLKQITDDPETFSQCTDTIIRHVEDIGRMVSEFSSFARMPEPVIELEDLSAHVRETLVLHQQAHPEVKFIMRGFEGERAFVHMDSAQIRQALNNLIQNAVDSIQMKDAVSGLVDILITAYGGDEIAVVLSDNGVGLPKGENPASLTEPYVTHKPKGTGLGLAIVKKIMEDHKGDLILGVPDWLRANDQWRDHGGATVVLVFPFEESAGVVRKKTA
jgi:two-component system nitrogen regulation sensor histidine kinase NtrY